jgi:hypothetical protein
MGKVRSLRAVQPASTPTPPTMCCARPSCGRPLPPHKGRGRPKVYCGDDCARLFVNERRTAIAEVLRSLAVAKQYGPVYFHELSSERAARNASGLNLPDLTPILEAASASCRRLADDEATDLLVRDVLVQARVALDFAAKSLSSSQDYRTSVRLE